MDEAGDTGFSESFILGLVASLGGLISLIFASMRKSRCNRIKCLCFECNREVLTKEELELEPKSPHTLNNV